MIKILEVGIMGGCLAILGLMIVFRGLVRLLDEKKYRWAIVLAIGIILLCIVSPGFFYISGTQDGAIEGRIRFQGTPTTSLKEGKRYSILAYTNTTKDGLLVLSSIPEKNVLLYTAPLKNLPQGLSVKDIVVFSEHKLFIIESP